MIKQDLHEEQKDLADIQKALKEPSIPFEKVLKQLGINEKFFFPRDKKAFTMTELLTAVVILAVLAALGLPNLHFFIERMRAQEMVPVLLSIYAAQKEHQTDNNGKYAANTVPAFPNLRLAKYLSLPATPNFRIEVRCGSNNCVAGPGGTHQQICTGGVWLNIVAQATRWNSVTNAASTEFPYRLYMFEDGRIGCFNTVTNTCVDYCERLGFETF